MDKKWLSSIEGSRVYQHLRVSMNRRLVSFFREEVLRHGQNLRVAEVACGSGTAAHLMATEPNVSMSLAGDISLEDFSQARVTDFKASFVLMDIFWPATELESLDFVWNSSSVEELENSEGAVRAMASMVKPGGYVFVGVPYKFGVAGIIGKLGIKSLNTWLGNLYSFPELENLFAVVGLKIQRRISYLGGTFIGLLGRKSQ